MISVLKTIKHGKKKLEEGERGPQNRVRLFPFPSRRAERATRLALKCKLHRLAVAVGRHSTLISHGSPGWRAGVSPKCDPLLQMVISPSIHSS